MATASFFGRHGPCRAVISFSATCRRLDLRNGRGWVRASASATVELSCASRRRPPASTRARSHPRPRQGALLTPLLGEQRAHRFLVRHARHRLGEQLRARELADARAGPRFVRQRDRVGDDELVELRSRDPLAPRRRTAPGACSTRRPSSRRAPSTPCAALHSVPAVSTMSSMITQVRPSTSPMMFITSATFAFGRRLSMIARSESSCLAMRARAHHAADVRRHDQQVLVVLLPQIAEQHRRRVDVVDRDVEEALDLVGVQIHRHHAIDADDLQHVRHDLRRDRHARRARPAILARVAEVRDGCGDPRRPMRA